MDINRDDLQRGQGTKGPDQGEPEAPKKAITNELSEAAAPTGMVPPPPMADPAHESTPEKDAPAPAKVKQGISVGQLDAIKAIKADPVAREAWFAKLDEAVKSGDIKVKNIVIDLKTQPEKLSIAAASTLLKYAPMKDPDAPATSSQVDVAARSLTHMVQSADLAARVQQANPDLHEKLMATGVSELTKAEASELIQLEDAHNKAISHRPASPDQLKVVDAILEKKPELEASLSQGFKDAREKGALTHGDIQYLISKERKLEKENNQEALTQAIEVIKDLPKEDLDLVAQATLTRIETSAGQTFKENAIKFVTAQVTALVDPDTTVRDHQKATEYFLQYNNAAALLMASQELARA